VTKGKETMEASFYLTMATVCCAPPVTRTALQRKYLQYNTFCSSSN